MRFKVASLLAGALIAASGCSSPPSGSSTAPTRPGPPLPEAGPTAVAAADSSPVLAISALSPSEGAQDELTAGPPAQEDGRTAPGPYFLGSPDAPVTVEEYSDFQ